MHAASREALARVAIVIDEQARSAAAGGTATSWASAVGTELFDVVEVLDRDRQLRTAVAQTTAPAGKRQSLVREVFSPHVAKDTLDLLERIVVETWSSPRELREGVVLSGRRVLLRGAESEGRLREVESELFDFARVLERNGALAQLLSDRASNAERRRGLAADVLYGKVSSFAEALILQAIGRPEAGPLDDIDSLAQYAARLRGREIARVTAAAPLSTSQRETLEGKLARVYDTEVSVHAEVDESLLGGLKVRVGDEVIDGSTAGKIARLRAAMAH